jgi:anti-sigma B factor antagonist
MSESKLEIQERQEDLVTVLILTGQITLDAGDLVFKTRVNDLLGQGRTKIVADMANVTYVDSAGLGMLASKLRTVREKGGDLKLARVSAKIQRVLNMMKLPIAFETFEDDGAAIRSFAGKGERL